MAALPKAKDAIKVVPSGVVMKGEIYDIIKKRQTEELVFAFCGPLGSGTSIVAQRFEEILKTYKYQTHYIKISSHISKNIERISGFGSIPDTDAAEKISKLQDAGNKLRQEYETDILAQFVIQDIAVNRQEWREAEGKSDDLSPESRRHVTIIDSLKHPDEVKLLKSVYGNMFYLFAILCPEQIRRNRLTLNKHVPSGKEVELMERDKSEAVGFGQKLLDTLQSADFFIRNDDVNVTILDEKIKRYIDLILGHSFITPTVDEYAMYCAQSAALKSSCLSRQVGAAIMSKEGELISTGFNDVPKFGGGHYSSSDRGEDGRCMNIYGKECANKKHKEWILKEIDEKLVSEVEDNTVRKKILEMISKHDRIKNLMEFSRAVHAEMDAIINVARLGGRSLKEAILYCTTFPCHNCARHIVASGITKVYYIEPYEKSLARALHGDAIDFDSKEKESEKLSKVAFRPFEGVAPKQYMNLFMAGEREAKGKRIVQDLSIAKPRVSQYLDNHIEYELKVIKYLEDNLNKA